MKAKRLISTDRHIRKTGRNKALDAVLCALVILSMSLVIWGINIYRRTIIEPKYLFVVVSLGTIVAAVILLFVAREFLSAIWKFIIAGAIGGGVAYFLILYLNKELSDSEMMSETFDIKKTGNLARGKSGSCRSPYAIIDFNGNEKQLVFYCEFEKSIHTYKKIRVKYFKGFFGFPVVQSQILVP